jgi:ATP-dependent helicase/nuclease subunit B
MPLTAGVELRGRADWVERNDAGELAIIDFKTGASPSARAMLAGFGVQLGLLGALATSAGSCTKGDVRELLYWKLSGGHAKPGEIKDVLRTRSGGSPRGRAWSDAREFIEFCLAEAIETARRYLVEGEPFLAKARPEFARPGDDFDHLARTDEWLAELYGEH